MGDIKVHTCPRGFGFMRASFVFCKASLDVPSNKSGSSEEERNKCLALFFLSQYSTQPRNAEPDAGMKKERTNIRNNAV
jgi:hypothetical protein